MLFGKKLQARTMRQITVGTSTAPVQHLPNPPDIPELTVRSLIIEDQPLQPVRPYYGLEKMYNVEIYLLRLIFVDWPKGSTEDFPIQAGDMITVPMGRDSNGQTLYKTYDVRGVEHHPGDHMEVYVASTPKGTPAPVFSGGPE